MVELFTLIFPKVYAFINTNVLIISCVSVSHALHLCDVLFKRYTFTCLLSVYVVSGDSGFRFLLMVTVTVIKSYKRQ